jgi:hypothetical protein
VTDGASQGTYGLRKFRLESPYLQDRNYASAFATILTGFLKDDRAGLVLQMRGLPTWQFYKQVGQFINFSSVTLGISATSYQILGRTHGWQSDNGQDVVTTFYLHRVLVDTTAITSSSLETAPRVPPAPPGYDDPGGDPDTIDTTTDDIPATSPLSGADHIVVLGKTLDDAGDVVYFSSFANSGYVEWEEPSYFSEDIENQEAVFAVATDDRIYLTQPGWYMVTLSGVFHAGTNSTTTNRMDFQLEGYTEGLSIAHVGAVGPEVRMSMASGEKLPFSYSYIFPRAITGGDTIAYLRLKLSNISPTPLATFFSNNRKVDLQMTIARIRRQNEE